MSEKNNKGITTLQKAKGEFSNMNEEFSNEVSGNMKKSKMNKAKSHNVKK